MNRKLPFFIIIALVLGIFSACNSDDDNQYTGSGEEYVVSANTAITSFYLSKNDSVLPYLDSVYFSIDLITAQIFNADSLPCGTDVSRLIVNITANTASGIEIIMPTATGDTTINHKENATDSIDFSRGGVKVRITAADTETKREYSVKVNVHNMAPDSLYWAQSAKSTLPTSLSGATTQKTVEYSNSVICFTGNGSNALGIATIANPGEGTWSKSQVSLGFTPDVNSITATDDALYMLATDGTLHTSTDGTAWSSCSVKFKHLYGAYGSSLLALRDNGGTLETIAYPGGTASEIEEGFPVSGTSQTVSFSTNWDTTPQVMMAGGIKADGAPTGAVWGYDGTRWMQISRRNLPDRSGYTFFPYFTFREGSLTWNYTEYTAWIALGGADSNGEPQNGVYVSIDGGMHWDKAGDMMQLPDYIPAMTGSQAIVAKSVLHARSAGSWSLMPSKKLPAWYMISNSELSRAITPITEWECPYIYLFGGYDENGGLYPTIWRGVINRLSFKPIQ